MPILVLKSQSFDSSDEIKDSTESRGRGNWKLQVYRGSHSRGQQKKTSQDTAVVSRGRRKSETSQNPASSKTGRNMDDTFSESLLMGMGFLFG